MYCRFPWWYIIIDGSLGFNDVYQRASRKSKILWVAWFPISSNQSHHHPKNHDPNHHYFFSCSPNSSTYANAFQLVCLLHGGCSYLWSRQTHNFHLCEWRVANVMWPSEVVCICRNTQILSCVQSLGNWTPTTAIPIGDSGKYLITNKVSTTSNFGTVTLAEVATNICRSLSWLPVLLAANSIFSVVSFKLHWISQCTSKMRMTDLKECNKVNE